MIAWLRSRGKQLLGLILVIVGLIGFLLPFLPGFVFFFLGLELLGWGILVRERVKNVWTRHQLDKHLKK